MLAGKYYSENGYFHLMSIKPFLSYCVHRQQIPWIPSFCKYLSKCTPLVKQTFPPTEGEDQMITVVSLLLTR